MYKKILIHMHVLICLMKTDFTVVSFIWPINCFEMELWTLMIGLTARLTRNFAAFLFRIESVKMASFSCTRFYLHLFLSARLYNTFNRAPIFAGLRQACLVPESAIFGAVEELKEKLEDLRNNTLMVFFVANAIWMIFLVTLIDQEHLKFLGTNVLGLVFLCIYGFIITIQFLTLLWHRGVTLFHVLARAPWKRGPLHMVWAFDDENLPPPPDERVLEAIRQHRGRSKPRKRRHNQDNRRLTSQASISSNASVTSIASNSDERVHLLPDGRPPSRSGYGSRDLAQKLSQPV